MTTRSFWRARARAEQTERRRRERRAKRAKLAVGAAVGATVIFAPSASAAGFEVNTLDDGAPDGCDSTDCTLREAVEDANANAEADAITFEPSLTGEITLLQGEIEISDPDGLSIEDTDPNQVTVSGDADGNDERNTGDSRIFNITTDAAVSITGLDMIEGFVEGGGKYGTAGGAIFAAETADVTLTSSRVADSQAGREGGGVFIETGSLDIVDSEISGNDAFAGGGLSSGAKYDPSPDVSISVVDSTITGNQAGIGGGINQKYGDLDVGRSSISDNEAAIAGGGLAVSGLGEGNSIEVSRSTIARNSLSEAAGSGGGVAVSGNIAGDLRVVDSTVSGNSAGSGAGVSFDEVDQPVAADRIAPEAASSRRAARVIAGGSVALDNSTIASNEATSDGGGVFFGRYYDSSDEDFDRATVQFTSTVVADNSADEAPNDLGQADDAEGGGARLTNSLVEAPDGVAVDQQPAGASIVGTDPALGPLTDNGGPTQTHLPASSSVVIDRGLANGLTIDQRGQPRTADRPAANGAGDGTDMGAVELAGDLPAPPPPAASAVCLDQLATIVARPGVPTVETPGRDVIVGTAGVDQIDAGPGNDVVCSGAGDDRVTGGTGNDRVRAGEDDDVVRAGTGNDRISGFTGRDRLSGEDGNDRLAAGIGNDVLSGGSGADYTIGLAGNDRIDGGDGNDKLGAGAGRDRVSGGDGRDSVFGRAGNDRISGGDGNDRLTGMGGNDVVDGGDGDDRLFGRTGNDSIFGRAGDDFLRGDEGEDRLNGGSGRDNVDGGPGRDRPERPFRG